MTITFLSTESFVFFFSQIKYIMYALRDLTDIARILISVRVEVHQCCAIVIVHSDSTVLLVTHRLNDWWRHFLKVAFTFDRHAGFGAAENVANVGQEALFALDADLGLMRLCCDWQMICFLILCPLFVLGWLDPMITLALHSLLSYLELVERLGI